MTIQTKFDLYLCEVEQTRAPLRHNETEGFLVLDNDYELDDDDSSIGSSTSSCYSDDSSLLSLAEATEEAFFQYLVEEFLPSRNLNVAFDLTAIMQEEQRRELASGDAASEQQPYRGRRTTLSQIRQRAQQQLANDDSDSLNLNRSRVRPYRRRRSGRVTGNGQPQEDGSSVLNTSERVEFEAWVPLKG